MLNRTIQYALDNRMLVVFLSLLVFLGGLFIARDIEVDVFPDLTAPTVAVLTDAHGMAAEEVEKLVSFPIESALNGATDVRRVRSSSSFGMSIVWVEFDWGTDIYKARQIVSEKLSIIGIQLPENVAAPSWRRRPPSWARSCSSPSLLTSCRFLISGRWPTGR